MQILKSTLLFLIFSTYNTVYSQDFATYDSAMSKIFPLLNEFQKNLDSRKVIESSPLLNELTNKRKNKIRLAIQDCQLIPKCWIEPLLFESNEIEVISVELKKLINQKKIDPTFVNSIRDSKVMTKFDTLPDEEMIASSWREAANGLNQILKVYALAENPRYPEIDSTSIDPNSRRGMGILLEAISQPEITEGNLFFSPTYQFAASLLYLEQRENAGYFPNLETQENKAAIENIRNINWDDYPYSSILILGDGPEIPGMRLGQFGKIRVKQAVKLFKENKAPLIIVSGGFVHPPRTQLNEANEMKSELMKRYGIEEKNIVMEPFARHTTTNFRNAVRLIYKYSIPSSKPAIVTSSKFHIDYCLTEEFSRRQLNELGYLAVTWSERKSPTTLEFFPSPKSLFIDSLDPLDP